MNSADCCSTKVCSKAGQNRSGFGEEAYPEVLKVAHFAREVCYLGRACL